MRAGGIKLMRALMAGALLTALCLPRAGDAWSDEAPFGTATSLTLANGLQVVTIEDHRSPVITHMVWYKFGGADDPPGAAGLAHLLEHLMFRSLDIGAPESFAQIMSRLGAVDNATTGLDSTWYFQRAAKENLPELMAVEARRMGGIAVTEDQAAAERAIVRQERRLVVESNPLQLLGERVLAALYQNHAYGRAPIGAAEDILTLKREDALTAHRSFYGPANAIVVIAGDVTPAQVGELATQTYGAVAGREPPARRAVPEPPALGARRVEMTDVRTVHPTLVRYYQTPSYRTAGSNQAESLEVLAALLGDGRAGRLNRALVHRQGVAIAAGAKFFGAGRDSGQFALFVSLPEGGDVHAAEQALDALLIDLLASGVEAEELAQAKSSISLRLILSDDSQQRLAGRYGEALAAGRSLTDLAGLAARLAQVGQSDVERAAREFLTAPRSVTGVLTPAPVAEKALP